MIRFKESIVMSIFQNNIQQNKDWNTFKTYKMKANYILSE